jgi:hypothetical protein
MVSFDPKSEFYKCVRLYDYTSGSKIGILQVCIKWVNFAKDS